MYRILPPCRERPGFRTGGVLRAA